MYKIPISAHLAVIALWLEFALHALFWRFLAVLFIFVLGISGTWAIANYSWWAAFVVASRYVHPFLPQCKANVRAKAWEIARRELLFLGEIRKIFRSGSNVGIWIGVSSVLKRLGTPESWKDAKDIYQLVARPEVKAEARYKLVSGAIWAILVTITLRFDRLDGPWALPRTHWLCWVVYAKGNYALIRMAHMVWIGISQFKKIQILQLRALLWFQRWALRFMSGINIVFEEILTTSARAVLENYDRLVWVLGKCIASLLGQLFFDLIITGIYRLWNGPLGTWDSSGSNLYLTIYLLIVRACIAVYSVFLSRHDFPQQTSTETDWTKQEQYAYTGLNENGRTIRLLVLHPRFPFAAIRCTLFEVSLKDLPSYDAISYKWGDPNIRENIWVNGKALSVPRSSYTILSNRSSVWRPQLLWMDAICINQEDGAEKSIQVPLMKVIYTKASIVSVCLRTPSATNGANPQPSRFHELREAFYASDVVHELAYLDLKTFSGDLEIYLKHAKSIRQPRWLAFQELVRNPWFTRIWVIQEVALASSIRVFYGRSQFSWALLEAAITTCFRHPGLASFLDITREEKNSLTRLLLPLGPVTFYIITEFRQRVKDNKMSFASALYESRVFAATNPRDHVFGLLGFYREESNSEHLEDNSKPSYDYSATKLFNHIVRHFIRIYKGRSGAGEPNAGDSTIWAMPDQIKPMYAKSVTKVYKDVAKYLLDQDHPLRLLSYAGIGFPDLETALPVDEKRSFDTETLPSWCPDWSRKPMGVILSYDARRQDHYSAGGRMSEKPRCPPKDEHASLVLRGRVLDIIVTLGQPFTPPSASSAKSDQTSNSLHNNSTSSTTELSSTYSVEKIIDFFKAASDSLDYLESTFKTKLYPYTTPRQTIREVFWRTLIGNRTSTKNPAPRSYSTSFELWMLFGKTMSNLSGPLNPHAQMRLDVTKENFGVLFTGCGLGRRMCVTEKGFVGMVPPLTLESNENEKRKGDVVFLVRGAEVPFVLRPVGEVEGRKRYQLVGEAYIHGVMDGEMAKWNNKGTGEEEIEII